MSENRFLMENAKTSEMEYYVAILVYNFSGTNLLIALHKFQVE